jgi:hypothetical protein
MPTQETWWTYREQQLNVFLLSILLRSPFNTLPSVPVHAIVNIRRSADRQDSKITDHLALPVKSITPGRAVLTSPMVAEHRQISTISINADLRAYLAYSIDKTGIFWYSIRVTCIENG